MAALFEKPVVLKPPEVVATHDFLMIGWVLLLLMSSPWIALGMDALAVGVLGFAGYFDAQIAGMLSTGSFIIDNFTGYFAFTFIGPVPKPGLINTPLIIGAGAIAFMLILVGVIYMTTVRRTTTGNYEGARAASLFYGVIMILMALGAFAAFLGYPYFATAALLIFPALFFLMGYGKMGEVIARYGPMAVLSDAAPIETAPQVPAGAAMPPIPVIPAQGIGMGGISFAPSPIGAMPMSSPMPPPTAPPQYQHLGGAVPRVPLCPSCGRELYYASNYKRWYCLVCESRR